MVIIYTYFKIYCRLTYISYCAISVFLKDKRVKDTQTKSDKSFHRTMYIFMLTEISLPRICYKAKIVHKGLTRVLVYSPVDNNNEKLEAILIAQF